MPRMLSHEAQTLILGLAAPLPNARRGEFLEAVEAELAGAATIGPGAAHRAARQVLARFWEPPPDLRVGRLGPRGPRNA